MIRPLVEHADRLFFHEVGEGILRHHRRAETGDQLVDAVVDFRVDMIRAAGKHDDAAAFFPGPGDHLCALCADIGKALGCGGAMASLERSAACGFSISEAHTIEEIEELSIEERLALLRPVEEIFSELDAVKLPVFYEKLFRSGCEIYLKKAKLPEYPVGTRLRVLDSKGGFFALGEVREYESGLAVKSIKLFVL